MSSLSRALESLRSSIATYYDAWATWRDTAANAHCAAVMGSSVTRHLRFSEEYTVADSINSDASLTEVIDALKDVEPRLQDKIEDHLSWVLGNAESAIVSDLTLQDPKFTLDSVANATRDLENKNEIDRVMADVERKLAKVKTEAESLSIRGHVAGMSLSRQRTIDTHTQQTLVIIEKSKELAFSDRAMSQINHAIALMKNPSADDARGVYKSQAFSKLQKERKEVETDRAHVELQLQAYFDHHSQGASRTESAKVEKVPLKLPPNLEKRQNGFKLITGMEDFLVGRGNEMWALIPDLRRICHDIDPIEHVHWRPECDLSAYPESIREYRRDQNRTLAQILLALFANVGLRSVVLSTGSYGVSKKSFCADPEDGCAIFWVSVQLFHPVDRKQRTKIENELALIHTKFQTGDPNTALRTLRDLTRQALDISARVRWYTTGVPLIETLSSRNAQFAVRLEEYRDKPTDPEDSAVELDLLASEILDVVNALDQAGTDWTNKRAFRVEESLDELEREVKHLKKSSTLKPSGKTSRGTTKAASKKEQHTCQKVGCNNKIERYKPGFKLCTSCVLECVEKKKDAPLKGGGVWKRRSKEAKKFLKAQRAKKAKARKRALKAKRVDENEEGSESDPETDAHPKSAYEKRYARRIEAIRNGQVAPDDDSDPELEPSTITLKGTKRRVRMVQVKGEDRDQAQQPPKVLKRANPKTLILNRRDIANLNPETVEMLLKLKEERKATNAKVKSEQSTDSE